MTTTPCGFCGAATYRLQAVPGYVVRAFDVAPDLHGDYTLDLEAGLAHYAPTEKIVERMNMVRYQLHKETCSAWAGPVGG